jgi:phosphatidylglycerophosphate synthase
LIDNHVRAFVPRFTGPLIRLYQRLGLTPNQLTLAALFVSLAASGLIVAGHFWLAILTWWLGRLLDGTDGVYARASGKTSLFGAHIDILADMASYSMVILALNWTFAEYQSCWMAVLFLYILCITGALSLGALEKERGVAAKDNRGLRLGAGIAEGGETGIAYTIFLLWPGALPYTLYLWLLVLAVTVVSRLLLAAHILR